MEDFFYVGSYLLPTTIFFHRHQSLANGASSPFFCMDFFLAELNLYSILFLLLDTSSCELVFNSHELDTGFRELNTSSFELDTSLCELNTGSFEFDTSLCEYNTKLYVLDTSKLKMQQKYY